MREITLIDPFALNEGQIELGLTSSMAMLMKSFSQKAREDMFASQEGTSTKGGRAANKTRDFVAEFLDGLHIIDGPKPKKPEDLKKCTFGIPCAAFRHSIVDSLSAHCRVSKTVGERAFWVVPDGHDFEGAPCVAIKCEPPTMQLDAVTQNSSGRTGSASSVSRGRFERWTAKLRLTYQANMVKPNQIWVAAMGVGRFDGMGAYRLIGSDSLGFYGGFTVISCLVGEPDMDARQEAAKLITRTVIKDEEEVTNGQTH